MEHTLRSMSRRRIKPNALTYQYKAALAEQLNSLVSLEDAIQSLARDKLTPTFNTLRIALRLMTKLGEFKKAAVLFRS